MMNEEKYLELFCGVVAVAEGKTVVMPSMLTLTTQTPERMVDPQDEGTDRLWPITFMRGRSCRSLRQCNNCGVCSVARTGGDQGERLIGSRGGEGAESTYCRDATVADGGAVFLKGGGGGSVGSVSISACVYGQSTLVPGGELGVEEHVGCQE